MAQEPFDPLTPQTRGQSLRANGLAAIKREIERTRVEMSETIGEIQERLRPDHLLQQAKDGVREAATGKVKNIMNSAGETAYARPSGRADPATTSRGTRRNIPIRIAVTARRDRLVDAARPQQRFGAMVRRVRHVVGSRRRYRAARSRRARCVSAAYASSAKQAVGEYASSARETVGEYASTARETVNEYAASAASSARMASRSRPRAPPGTATTTLDDCVHDNPLAAGAFALAVGAAIGLAVPRDRVRGSRDGRDPRSRRWRGRGMPPTTSSRT